MASAPTLLKFTLPTISSNTNKNLPSPSSVCIKFNNSSNNVSEYSLNIKSKSSKRYLFIASLYAVVEIKIFVLYSPPNNLLDKYKLFNKTDFPAFTRPTIMCKCTGLLNGYFASP